jgi:glycosyltransferase involved in cell wall biosynthesis
LKISIVTPCFNSSATVAHTIESVLAQDHEDVEYIVVDGGSTDGTRDIVVSYGDKIAKFISEPDKGIYDAMNKGIKTASGDIIGIINSDDFYVDNDVLSKIVNTFEASGVDAVYGDLVYVDEVDTDRIVRNWKAGEYAANSFRWGWHPPHPCFFVKREFYERLGFFRDELRISADYELMLRYLHINSISVAYLPETLVKMRTGGASGAGLSARKRAYEEDKKAWELNGLNAPIGAVELKKLRKLIQWL